MIARLKEIYGISLAHYLLEEDEESFSGVN